MLDDLTRSVKEAVSDGVQDPLNTTGKSFFGNIMTRFKGRLLFSAIFFLVFGAVVLFVLLIIGYFVLKAL
jgi:hypothetical protein